MCDEISKTLSEAVEGLMYPSERDAPIEVICRPADEAKNTRDLVKKLARRRRVRVVKEEEFFAALTRVDDAERFARLGRIFQEKLADRGIYRIGEGETAVDIYLIGREGGGRWVCLHTVSIET